MMFLVRCGTWLYGFLIFAFLSLFSKVIYHITVNVIIKFSARVIDRSINFTCLDGSIIQLFTDWINNTQLFNSLTSPSQCSLACVLVIHITLPILMITHQCTIKFRTHCILVSCHTYNTSVHSPKHTCIHIYVDWLQSLKQFFINTCSQSNSDGSVLKTEPSELDWLQVYDMIHWWKIVLRTGASLIYKVNVLNYQTLFSFCSQIKCW